MARLYLVLSCSERSRWLGYAWRNVARHTSAQSGVACYGKLSLLEKFSRDFCSYRR
jgi:hypothetical protein